MEEQTNGADAAVEADTLTQQFAQLATEQALKGAAPLTRDAFRQLAKQKRRTVRVDLPWLGAGAHTYVLVPTARERDAFEATLVTGTGKKAQLSTDNVRARMLVRWVSDADGTRLFGDNEADAMGELGAKTVDAIYRAIQRESGITDDDVEELAGNSGAARSAGS